MVLKAEFTSIVGKEDVLDGADILKSYSRDQSFASPCRPSLVVQPGCAEEIERLVALAKRKGYKLVPVSSGGCSIVSRSRTMQTNQPEPWGPRRAQSMRRPPSQESAPPIMVFGVGSGRRGSVMTGGGEGR